MPSVVHKIQSALLKVQHSNQAQVELQQNISPVPTQTSRVPALLLAAARSVQHMSRTAPHIIFENMKDISENDHTCSVSSYDSDSYD